MILAAECQFSFFLPALVEIRVKACGLPFTGVIHHPSGKDDNACRVVLYAKKWKFVWPRSVHLRRVLVGCVVLVIISRPEIIVSARDNCLETIR